MTVDASGLILLFYFTSFFLICYSTVCVCVCEFAYRYLYIILIFVCVFSVKLVIGGWQPI